MPDTISGCRRECEMTQTVVLATSVTTTDVPQSQILVTPAPVAPTLSVNRTGKVTQSVPASLVTSLSLTPSLAAARLRSEPHLQILAIPVLVDQTLSAMSTDLATQCASVSQAMSQLQTPSPDVRRSLILAIPTPVVPMLSVFPQAILPPVGVLLVTREILSSPVVKETASMTVSAPTAWHVLTTTARIPVLAPVVRMPTVRSGTIVQSVAARRDSEAIL